MARTVFPTLLDRLIGYLSPSAGLRRLSARFGMDMLTGGGTGHLPPVRRRAASDEGTLGSWHPRRETRWQATGGLDTAMTRAESLTANDGHAASAVNSLALNVAGGGLLPQCHPDARLLGISEDQAAAFADSAERAWALWCAGADAAGLCHFNDIQFEAARSLFVFGEFLHLPVWREGRPYGLAIQPLHPARLRTPADMLGDGAVRCGVRMDATGAPLGYWIANPPPDCVSLAALTSKDFSYVPRLVGHRATCLHCFHAETPEQVRGVSILAPAMKLIRDLADFVDYQLVGAMIAASFTVFIETPQDLAGLSGLGGDAPAQPLPGYPNGLQPGTVVTGKAGDKPHIISSDRPGATFDSFYERMVRAVASSTGQPYEQVAKDFSKTTYSSARAALLEVWKLHALYQSWFERRYLDVIWDMVLEEAWLRGMLEVPGAAPSLFAGPQARRAWLRCRWTRPPRGQIDPVKERNADLLGLASYTETRTDICRARGLDFDTQILTRKREEQKLRELGLLGAAPATQNATEENSNENEDADAAE